MLAAVEEKQTKATITSHSQLAQSAYAAQDPDSHPRYDRRHYRPLFCSRHLKRSNSVVRSVRIEVYRDVQSSGVIPMERLSCTRVDGPSSLPDLYILNFVG